MENMPRGSQSLGIQVAADDIAECMRRQNMVGCAGKLNRKSTESFRLSNAVNGVQGDLMGFVIHPLLLGVNAQLEAVSTVRAATNGDLCRPAGERGHHTAQESSIVTPGLNLTLIARSGCVASEATCLFSAGNPC